MKLKTEAMAHAGLFLYKNLLVTKLACPNLMFAITASTANNPTNYNSFNKVISITNVKPLAETIISSITDYTCQPVPKVNGLPPSAYKHRITSSYPDYS